jgi:hypothetical protein
MYTFVRPARAEGGALDQVADGVDAVVGGGVELGHRHRRARLDRPAGAARPARLAVGEVLAVERLGEDPAVDVLPVPRGPLKR